MAQGFQVLPNGLSNLARFIGEFGARTLPMARKTRALGQFGHIIILWFQFGQAA
jgi:hypothetical protein